LRVLLLLLDDIANLEIEGEVGFVTRRVAGALYIAGILCSHEAWGMAIWLVPALFMLFPMAMMVLEVGAFTDI